MCIRDRRITVAAFAMELNPTMEEIEDIRTSVSEAVTNAIIHGYEEKEGMVEIHCVLLDRLLHIEIKDNGKGIPDVEKAKQPFYTTKETGMGIGLNLCRSIVESHNGHLAFRDNPEGGTIFYFDLSLAR